MNKKLLQQTLLLVVGINISACTSNDNPITAQGAKTTDVLAYVDPFIGTGGHGHTFPGAVVPFGMVQLTRLKAGIGHLAITIQTIPYWALVIPICLAPV